MIGFAAEKLIAMEVGAATGAGYGEKSALRVAMVMPFPAAIPFVVVMSAPHAFQRGNSWQTNVQMSLTQSGRPPEK
jgi:hypothetical protein